MIVYSKCDQTYLKQKLKQIYLKYTFVRIISDVILFIVYTHILDIV